MVRRLIEEWLPIAEIGIESTRERTPMTPFPAPNRLHVWWARRPLVASRAALLASLLPADADRGAFLHALGIHGNPVAARRALDLAKLTGNRIPEPYGYTRAFGYTATEADHDALDMAKLGDVTVLDPTAGGGAIPFEAVRLGFNVAANDLNSVAAVVLNATVKLPMESPVEVHREYRRLSAAMRSELENRLGEFYPTGSEDTIDTTYLWARTIICPYCSGLIPLSPNWRLAPDGTGVKLKPEVAGGPGSDGRRCDFEIVHSTKLQSEGTVNKGDATCPYPDCGRVVDSDEVKRQAQTGKMGEQLYTVIYKDRVSTTTKSGKPGKDKWVRGYRAPLVIDDVADLVRRRLSEKTSDWEMLNIMPTEDVPTVINDDRPIQYGMPKWRNLFSPRQLYGHATSVEIYQELLAKERQKPSFDKATEAAFIYLAIALDKLVNYINRASRWDSTTYRVRSMFDRHDFSFKWSYAEMAPLTPGLGYDWAFEETEKSVTELIDLIRPDIDGKALRKNEGELDFSSGVSFSPPQITITSKSADHLDHISSGSVDAIVMDPPYYDNVMYAELSDFFYVWLKRTAGLVMPELFTRQLTDKDNEAVANPAKFKGTKGAKKLAGEEYRERMAAIFRECRRVLRDDGIMTLMFTHKATGAWDALTTGLVEAGFLITASWPINTEAEGSLHIKDKAAANSTVFLVCRPRPPKDDSETVYWEDLEPRVREAVRARVADYQTAGIGGVDLYLSSFGPALEVFSRHWPVKRGRPRPKPKTTSKQQLLFEDERDPYAATPEDALEVARREVKEWRLHQLMSVSRQVSLDPLTEWFVLAWDAFKAPKFPYDEALRLARVVGVDLDRNIVKKLVEKKQSDVILWDSSTRAAKGSIGPASGSTAMLDAIHHLAHAARTRSLQAAREILEKSELLHDPAFLSSFEAVLEVLPRSKSFSGFEPAKAQQPHSADFDVLEQLRRLLLADEVDEPKQMELDLGG